VAMKYSLKSLFILTLIIALSLAIKYRHDSFDVSLSAYNYEIGYNYTTGWYFMATDQN